MEDKRRREVSQERSYQGRGEREPRKAEGREQDPRKVFSRRQVEISCQGGAKPGTPDPALRNTPQQSCCHSRTDSPLALGRAPGSPTPMGSGSCNSAAPNSGALGRAPGSPKPMGS
eukprot:355824-Chlamydomonas_euryale.AAC.1